jgi:hypothetical protein
MKCPNCQSEDLEKEKCLPTEFMSKAINIIYQCRNCTCDFQSQGRAGVLIISEGIKQQEETARYSFENE